MDRIEEGYFAGHTDAVVEPPPMISVVHMGFRSALREDVAFHHPGLPGDVGRECEQLLSLVE